ncbi:protein PBDC1-like isoform X3 [Dendropsophus ebraccatus]|uniref:protein PBDC1-like isoform X3 n=1 Tax=Dendropsophus ebraccatus TaxID=150705 RepID=UPI003831F010
MEVSFRVRGERAEVVNMAAPGDLGGLGSLGAAEALSVADALSLPAESYGNDPNIEMAWAMKAYQHAEVYFNLISSVDPRLLKLTRMDDGIYTAFRKDFPDLRIDVIDPEDLKSPAAKEKWRPFCMQFENQVEDFNYGTLLRLESSKEYTEENTIFSTRIQFFAIEIARNREGCNDVIYNHRLNHAAE